MEAELTCPVCHEFFKEPVALPCSHNLCYSCAKKTLANAPINCSLDSSSSNDGASDDSGYMSISEFQNLCTTSGAQYFISCLTCSKNFGIDDRGVDGLPRNFILEGLIQRFQARNNEVDCQLCETDTPAKAAWMCEQCQVAYCDECLKTCHPKRGPLAKHSLVPPNADKVVQNSTKSRGILKCNEHDEENISMYCTHCKYPVCYLCFEGGRHSGHEAKALGLMFKEQKTELAKSLKKLTENHKEVQKFMQCLQESIGKTQENALEFEARVVAQFDALIRLLEERKAKLLEMINASVQEKGKILRAQSDLCREKMKSTSGLLQYTLEVLKENDAATFLMVSDSLNNRLRYAISNWIGKHGLKPATSSDVDLSLDTSSIADALNSLHFVELKGPGVPEIIPEECSVTNNSIVLAWQITSKSRPDGFVVELDDGMGGELQTVCETEKNYCSLGGLQFQSTYRARVKAFNKAGEGLPSDVVYLTTPDIAVFSVDPSNTHPDITFSNDNLTLTCSSYENRVALADVGFSRGRHYWEVHIDRYEGNPDPAIGVAQEDTMKDAILGRDNRAWSAYVDSNRSWFQHNNEHLFRSEGGIGAGSTLGLLLDLDNCTLTFYCNEDRRGPVSFPSLTNADVVYPAFSLNRNVSMTLHTGLEPPDMEDEDV